MVMEPRYLLDTNICIYIRQQKSPALLRRFEKLRPREAAISVVTYGELFYVAQKSAYRATALERLRELAALLPALALPEGASDWYGRIRADLERKGKMIGNNDMWIAVHALSADLILVTNDEGEFKRIPGIAIENWATQS